MGAPRLWAFTALRTSVGEIFLACIRFVIQIDHHLTLLPTVWQWNHRARNRDHLRPDKIQRQVIQLLFRETLTRESKLKNRYARSAEIDNLRRFEYSTAAIEAQN